MQLPPYLSIPLLYVEFLQVAGMPEEYTGTGVGLYKVQHIVPSQASAVEFRAVVPIMDMVHSV
jgi:hypothetical protein